MRNACQCRSGGSSVDDHAGATREHRCIRLYSRIQLYRLGALAQRASREEKGGRPPADRHHHSRARARARVTMRTRIMRASCRARARARGDTPWICSRIINGVEDYRRAVLGSSKNQPGQAVFFEGSAWPARPAGPWIWPKWSNPIPGLTRVSMRFRRRTASAEVLKSGSRSTRPRVVTHE